MRRRSVSFSAVTGAGSRHTLLFRLWLLKVSTVSWLLDQIRTTWPTSARWSARHEPKDPEPRTRIRLKPTEGMERRRFGVARGGAPPTGVIAIFAREEAIAVELGGVWRSVCVVVVMVRVLAKVVVVVDEGEEVCDAVIAGRWRK